MKRLSRTSAFRYALYTAAALSLVASSVLAFAVAPADRILGESSRLIYIHVPLAVSAVLSFILSGIFAALFLLRPETGEEPLARVAHLVFIAALVATAFCFAAVFVLPLC